MVKRPLPFIILLILLVLTTSGFAGEGTATSAFIPVDCSFSFAAGKVVNFGVGDINVFSYGIETMHQEKVEIAQLHKGFVEDVKSLPDEEEIEWASFEEFQIGMIYVVRCVGKKFALFELLDVKVSDNDITGIEIKYKYQPNGSSYFD